ncbi:MAG TPA: hypothetical protein VK402_14015 [Blastococcus sp.]|nr:hypothetical protein [Blastococcus sp.]
MGEVDEDRPRRPKQKYWGLRTLGFLTIALVSVIASNWVNTGLPVLGLVVGLTGAAYCSYRGLKDFTWLPR